MIQLAVIGTDLDFQQRYAPSLLKLSEQIHVTGVYDPVLARSEKVARDFSCRVFFSLQELVHRFDVDCLMFTAPQWYGLAPALMGVAAKKTVFLCDRCLIHSPWSQQLLSLTGDQGHLVIPESRYRYAASFLRFNELVITDLGEPREFHFQLASFDLTRPIIKTQLLHLFNWMMSIIPLPGKIQIQHSDTPSIHVQLQFHMESSERNKGQSSINLNISSTKSNLPQDISDFPTIDIQCLHGSATIPSTTEIHWGNGQDSQQEILADEARSLERQLTQFGRRVVGGLVPVPSYADFEYQWRLIDSLQRSLETHQQITLDYRTATT